MSLIPENRMEQILAGENITPESRTEAFAKEAIDNAGSGGGGSELPTPGSVGNVLTSTGDGWESAAPQSGGAIVYYGHQGDADNVYVTEADPDDIVAAYNANKTVIMRDNGGGHTMPDLYLKMAYEQEVNEATIPICMFGNDMSNGEDSPIIHTVTGYKMGGESSWTIADSVLATGASLPNASPSDNGKILGVDNGAYALVDRKAPVEFGFDIAVDTSGGSPVFTATARTGSSYANITAAMAAQPNVYMRAYLPDNEVLVALFNRKRQNLVSASGLVPDYNGTTLANWQVFGLNVEDSDTLVVFFNNLTSE